MKVEERERERECVCVCVLLKLFKESEFLYLRNLIVDKDKRDRLTTLSSKMSVNILSKLDPQNKEKVLFYSEVEAKSGHCT